MLAAYTTGSIYHTDNVQTAQLVNALCPEADQLLERASKSSRVAGASGRPANPLFPPATPSLAAAR
jgi:hypothetical protein